MKLQKRMIFGRLPRRFHLSLTAIIVTSFALTVHASPAEEEEPQQQVDVTQKVYVLECAVDESVWNLPPQGLHWKALHKMLDEQAAQLIEITDRAEVDNSIYLDTEGLRLYVSSHEGLRTLKQLPEESSEHITLAYLIRNLLGRRYAERGIEPDRIPVHGQAGKKPGNQGMLLVKGGEYVRPGHYFTSQSAELAKRTGEKYKVGVPAFFIDKYKVTNAEYCEFLNDGNPGYWNSVAWSNIERNDDGRFLVDAEEARWPVIAVNWYQAAGYAEWAGKRLPTEAE